MFIGPEVNQSEIINRVIVTIKKKKGFIELDIDLNVVSKCLVNECLIKIKTDGTEIKTNAIHPIGIKKLKILVII